MSRAISPDRAPEAKQPGSAADSPARKRGFVGPTSTAVARFFANEAVQVGALLLAALLVRLAFHDRSPVFVSKDSQSYFLPGWELARAQPFELGQRRTPGYPLFIAAVILALGEDLQAVALAQHLLGIATVGVTYLLGRLTFGRGAGLVAGFLVALSGPLLIYERYVMSETLFGLLLGLTLLAGAVAVRRRASGRRWLLAGAALGLTILTRPVAQLLIPLLCVAALLANGRDWRRGFSGAAALLVGVAVIQGPWVFHNALEKGNPAASTFGRTLIARTAYYDRGFVFAVPGEPDPDPRRQRAREIVQDGARQHESDGIIAGRLRQELNLGPVEVNALMRDIAMGAILRNPVHYLESTVAFTQEIFVGVDERLREHYEEYRDVNPWDDRIRALVRPPTDEQLSERPSANRVVNLYQPARYAPVLAGLFALGIALGLLVPRYRLALLPACAVAILLLAHAALDGPVERYRYPLDPQISVLVGGGLAGGASLLLSGLRRPRHGIEQAHEARAATV
jgi:4-amino-4-deoxy-L-arabinose transferase-like glycosyltransferase